MSGTLIIQHIFLCLLFKNKNDFLISKNLSLTTSLEDAISDLLQEHGSDKFLVVVVPDIKEVAAQHSSIEKKEITKLLWLECSIW